MYCNVKGLRTVLWGYLLVVWKGQTLLLNWQEGDPPSMDYLPDDLEEV